MNPAYASLILGPIGLWALMAVGANAAPSDAERADRDAVARVAYAEAGGQGDSGLAAVVRVVLNRLASGKWGSSVESVLTAKGQFEPVMRAEGDWRRLPRVTAAQQARIDTIINLTLDGRIPDLTNGAQYFQNPTIVADRANRGLVSANLVKFGMSPPSAVIGSHWFFRTAAAPVASGRSDAAGGPIFIRAPDPGPSPSPPRPDQDQDQVLGDMAQALPDGAASLSARAP